MKWMLPIVVFLMLVAALIMSDVLAHADHGGPTYEHECPLPNGDPRGWPCTHTVNGQKYIDWSYAYINDARFPNCPATDPWCAQQ